MTKKKFNKTKVGKFLSKAAPGILDLAGNVLPDLVHVERKNSKV